MRKVRNLIGFSINVLCGGFDWVVFLYSPIHPKGGDIGVEFIFLKGNDFIKTSKMLEYINIL